MTRIRRGRSTVPLLGMALVGVLVGCGIQPTGAVDGGKAPAATLRIPKVYFVADGIVRPVSLQYRPGVAQSRPEVLEQTFQAFEALLRGPDEPGRRAGLATEVTIDANAIELPHEAGDPITVEVLGPPTFSALALAQVSCTMTSTTQAEYLTDWYGRVLIRGSNGSLVEAPLCPPELLDAAVSTPVD